MVAPTSQLMSRLPLGLIFAVLLAIIVAAVLVTGVLPPNWRQVPDLENYDLVSARYEPIAFTDLKDWHADQLVDALPAFVRSCTRVANLADDAPFNPKEAIDLKQKGTARLGTVADWRPACVAAQEIDAARFSDPNALSAAVRNFFQDYFTPVHVVAQYERRDGARGPTAHTQKTGRLTGYFEPAYEARRGRDSEFSAPVYRRPDDLISVDLGGFDPDLAGKRIAGRLLDGALRPYPDRAAINQGAIISKTAPLAFLRPNELFFLQIQGSGKLEFEGKDAIYVGYDGQNGHKYFPIGRRLVEDGVLSLEAVSMQSIMDWLRTADADKAQEVREENKSYVFFRQIEGREDDELGPIGAQGVQLTALRSIAVDTRFHGLGTPIWVVAENLERSTDQMGWLLIAQDTGGAIKGPSRGDVFVGTGREAGDLAGPYNSIAAFYALLPKSVARNLAGDDT
ncbi:MAG: MltA domain-containing protein [Pseudomonadota bacterium]